MDAKFKVICDHVVGNPSQNFTLLGCPRCLGNGFYNASSYGHDGKVVTVFGQYLLIQQIQKILTEEKRPTGYGFDYTVLTGTINAATLTAVKAEVLRCLQYLSDSQQQEKLEGHNYLPTEEIQSVGGVDAFIPDNEPRMVIVNASVTTISGASITATNIPLRK
jgi:hypothetical protein